MTTRALFQCCKEFEFLCCFPGQGIIHVQLKKLCQYITYSEIAILNVSVMRLKCIVFYALNESVQKPEFYQLFIPYQHFVNVSGMCFQFH
jgi:hypothetical protein